MYFWVLFKCFQVCFWCLNSSSLDFDWLIMCSNGNVTSYLYLSSLELIMDMFVQESGPCSGGSCWLVKLLSRTNISRTVPLSLAYSLSELCISRDGVRCMQGCSIETHSREGSCVLSEVVQKLLLFTIFNLRHGVLHFSIPLVRIPGSIAAYMWLLEISVKLVFLDWHEFHLYLLLIWVQQFLSTSWNRIILLGIEAFDFL